MPEYAVNWNSQTNSYEHTPNPSFMLLFLEARIFIVASSSVFQLQFALHQFFSFLPTFPLPPSLPHHICLLQTAYSDDDPKQQQETFRGREPDSKETIPPCLDPWI